MRRIAEFVLRHRKLVVLAWAVLFVVGAVSAGATSKRLVIDFSLPGQAGTEASNKIIHDFGNGGSTSPYLVSVTAPAGQTLNGHEAEVARAFQAAQQAKPGLRVIDEATSGNKVFRTKDNRTAFALVFYPPPHNQSFKLPTEPLRHATTAAVPAGWTVGVTGEDALAAGDSSGGGGNSVLLETLLGGFGALLVLAFVFASFLALLPLIVAAASILLTFVFLLPLTYATNVSFIVQFLVSLIGLGVAIDYSLLLVTRWREERDHGRDNHDAVVVAMETAGRAVVFSGVTVAIGLIALVVLPVPFMRSIGIGGALIPLASVLTTLTLTPAILGGIGPRVDWPRIRHENKPSRLWAAWADPAWCATACIAAVVAVRDPRRARSPPSSGPRSAWPVLTRWPSEVPRSTAFQQLKNGRRLDRLADPDAGPDHRAGRPESGDRARPRSTAFSTRSSPPIRATSRNGQTVVVVVPTSETVNSATVGTVRRVKTAAKADPNILGVAGPGADQIDFLKAVYGNFPLMLALIALLTFVLLARGFRSVVLPIKAVLLNLLTVAATLGFMVLVLAEGPWFERHLRRSCHRRGHLLGAADGLRVPLRAVHGLRGVHPVAYP